LASTSSICSVLKVRNVDMPLSSATRTRSYSPLGSHSACVPMIDTRCTRSPITLTVTCGPVALAVGSGVSNGRAVRGASW
jgi:hypothetical protein